MNRIKGNQKYGSLMNSRDVTREPETKLQDSNYITVLYACETLLLSLQDPGLI